MKSHKDYIEIIGLNWTTAKGRHDTQWNKYYFKTNSKVVSNMLENVNKDMILDVGTSNGSWYEFWSKEHFNKIYGVELCEERTKLARKKNYTEVFNCDATETPLANNTLDVAVSNGVFVHILKKEDKILVLKKIESLLKPGGYFIFNHTTSEAFGYGDAFTVKDYCSFMSFDELVKMIHENTNFNIVDVKPTFYLWRNHAKPIFIKVLQRFIKFPFAPELLRFIDKIYTKDTLSINQSDAIYVKLQK